MHRKPHETSSKEQAIVHYNYFDYNSRHRLELRLVRRSELMLPVTPLVSFIRSIIRKVGCQDSLSLV